LLSGIYTTMYTAGSGGTTDHDDFGQKRIWYRHAVFRYGVSWS
jgi:hypothetical protein